MDMWLFRVFPSASLAVASIMLASLCSPLMAGQVVKLTGAGASFPAPLYQRWFRDYFLAHTNVHVDYQAIGSGGGIANFIEGRLDFAGSDLPMTVAQADRVEGGGVQIPMTAGAVVMVYNLPGVDGLKLPREAVAGIFLGKVERWNDPIIRAANAGVELPDRPITVVARAGSSGTTYVTTRHLSAISEEFAKTVGVTMTPVWPKILKERGALIRGQGNGGVAAYIKAVPGSIGYVQYAYGHLTNMQMASLQNQAGRSCRRAANRSRPPSRRSAPSSTSLT
jgi:phosphate transport system substrate-binding protein